MKYVPGTPVPARPGSADSLDTPHREHAGSQRSPFAVLIVDDDVGTCETVTAALKLVGIAVTSALSAQDGIALARERGFDLMLLDLRLPDMPGTEVVLVLALGDAVPLPFVVLSGYLTIERAVVAMKLGALDVIEKPIDVDVLTRVVLAAVLKGDPARRPQPGGAETPAAFRTARSTTWMRPRSAAERWAMLVLKATEADGDPRTLEDWASAAGVSYSSLCEQCRLLGIRPHDARDLARLLRATIKAAELHCAPEVLLNVSDRRTLKQLLARAGVGAGRGLSLAHLLRSQKFVPEDNEGLIVLTALLALRLEGTGGSSEDGRGPHDGFDRSTDGSAQVRTTERRALERRTKAPEVPARGN
jgi:DNA-binding response OmpR family regulator